MVLSNCLGQWHNLGFWEVGFVAITSTKGPSLGLRFGSCEGQGDAPLRSPFKKELTMLNTVSALNSIWPITLQSTYTSRWWVTVHHSESNGDGVTSFSLRQASTPALTEIFLDNLDWQASEDTIRWWGIWPFSWSSFADFPQKRSSRPFGLWKHNHQLFNLTSVSYAEARKFFITTY